MVASWYPSPQALRRSPPRVHDQTTLLQTQMIRKSVFVWESLTLVEFSVLLKMGGRRTVTMATLEPAQVEGQLVGPSSYQASSRWGEQGCQGCPRLRSAN